MTKSNWKRYKVYSPQVTVSQLYIRRLPKHIIIFYYLFSVSPVVNNIRIMQTYFHLASSTPRTLLIDRSSSLADRENDKTSFCVLLNRTHIVIDDLYACKITIPISIISLWLWVQYCFAGWRRRWQWPRIEDGCGATESGPTLQERGAVRRSRKREIERLRGPAAARGLLYSSSNEFYYFIVIQNRLQNPFRLINRCSPRIVYEFGRLIEQ